MRRAWWIAVVLLGCAGESASHSAEREAEPAPAEVSPAEAAPAREAEPSEHAETLAAPEAQLTDVERCALDGAPPDCLVRLADDIEADDPERARSLREEACFNGSTEACDRLGH